MGKKCFLGIDTSNYTTSVAIVDDAGNILYNERRLLAVGEGERGLRQSDALFQHVKQLPLLLSGIGEITSEHELMAVGVSKTPRDAVGSYMPCFLAGVSVASAIASACSVPLSELSHQAGHLMAAAYSSELDLSDRSPFLAFHVSGGTTEALYVKIENNGFSVELAGESADLNAGQVIDRVGVHLGLPFPAGASLEELALTNTMPIPKRKISAKDRKINLSGLENMAKELYEKNGDKALVASFVFDYIGRSLSALTDACLEKYKTSRVLYAGGVMCNSIIKGILKREGVYFADRSLSSDNAVGIALLCKENYLKK